MLNPVFERSFMKSFEKVKKRGKDMRKLSDIMELLKAEKPLPIRCRCHKLQGKFAGYKECHIEPDWLLIYQVTRTEIIFADTGKHSDLF